MDYLKRKLAGILFGEEEEISVRQARQRASVLRVPRSEFREFRQEMELLGILEIEGNGKKQVLKKIWP